MKSSLRVQSQSESARIYRLEGADQNAETLTVKTLEWDSQVLGLRCASLSEMSAAPIEWAEYHYQPLVDDLHRSGLQYVIARRPQGEWARIHALEAAGFRLIDGIIELGKATAAKTTALKAPAPLTALYQTRWATPSDGEAVAQLSAQTFTQSRFHNDPRLRPALARKIHYEWGKNACLGIAAQAVALIESQGRLAGFVTCSLNETCGSIGLIGVNQTDTGNGLGVALVALSCQWFAQMKRSEIRVQTQSNNLAALRLYSRTGFTPLSSHVTLRWCANEFT